MTEQRAKNFTLSLSFSPLPFPRLVHRSPPSTDHGRHPPLRSVEGSEVERTKRCARESKHPRAIQIPSLEPACVHSDVPRVLVARRSVDYIGTCAVASQPAARQNYSNRGVALSTAWYLVAYGTVRIARYCPPVSACSPVNQVVFCGSGLFFWNWFRFLVSYFLNSWYWWYCLFRDCVEFKMSLKFWRIRKQCSVLVKRPFE